MDGQTRQGLHFFKKGICRVEPKTWCCAHWTAILLGVITTHLCQSNESNRFFISTPFWLFYCNLQIQAGHIWLLWGILVVIFPAEWFILCSKVSAAAGETFSWWLCSCRLPQAAIASSFFKPRALLPPCSTHLLEQFHAIKVPHHAHCTSTPIPIGFFLKKWKLFYHFLSLKSSERGNNLSYIFVTYPGSAGW